MLPNAQIPSEVFITASLTAQSTRSTVPWHLTNGPGCGSVDRLRRSWGWYGPALDSRVLDRHKPMQQKEIHVRKVSTRSTVLLLIVAAVAALVATGAGASVGKKAAGIQVCGLMPDTKTSVRWLLFDQPSLIKSFKAAGVTARVVNAQGDPQKQKTQADQSIADGAKVLIIAPIDSGSAAAIEKAALAKGVKSIDYDRQVEGGVAVLYASFNNHTVGLLQGKGVVNGLKANGKYGSHPVVAE